MLQCVSYQLLPERFLTDTQPLPSAVYKKVIVTGAIENNLPKEYLDFLSNVKDNGYNGEVEVPLSFHQVSDQKVSWGMKIWNYDSDW